jgi:HlyD family secretion protein
MGMQQQVTNFKVKIRMSSVPDKIRPGMSSTVNIITETMKNAISIPIQSLTSRPENYEDLKKDSEIEESSEGYLKRVDPIDIVFVLVDTFNDLKAPDGKKFAVIKPIKVGISSENYYSVLSGVSLNDTIVTGGYRLLSKDLYHGDIVSLKNNNN